MRKLIIYSACLASQVFFSQELEKKSEEVEKEIEEVYLLQGKFVNQSWKQASENVQIITKKDIEQSASKDFGELLQHFTGMDVQRRGAYGVQADVSIRGGSFDQVLILLNGVQMNDAQTGHNSLLIPVDLSAVEKIEVIKGPGARRFGQNAYAGVINIITKTSEQEKVKISVQGGDYQTYGIGMTATFGKGKFQNLFQTNHHASSGYRYNTDYDIQNVYYQGKLLLNRGSLGIQAGIIGRKFGANGFYASPLYQDQYEETQASVVSVNYEQKHNNFGINSSIYWRRGQDMYLFVRKNPSVYRNMHIGNNLGGSLNLSYTSKLGVTGLGTDIKSERLVSNRLGDRQRWISQVFFEHHFSFFNDKFKVIPGVSWINFSERGNFFYPGLDMSWNFSENHKVYGNIAQVHRTPTYTDLYYLSSTEKGNENLVSEQALSSEIGYVYNNRNTGSTFKTSVFKRDTNNHIDFVRNSDARGVLWEAQNVVSVKLWGLEAEVEQKIKSINSLFSVGYTYMNAKSSTSYLFSKYVMNHFKHQVIAKMENQFLKSFYHQLVYRYQERVGGNSQHIVDDKLGFRKNNLDVYMLINNLTNTQYTEAFGVPMPGRWFHLGVSYTID